MKKYIKQYLLPEKQKGFEGIAVLQIFPYAIINLWKGFASMLSIRDTR